MTLTEPRNEYPGCLRNYAIIAESRGLHVEAAGMREIANWIDAIDAAESRVSALEALLAKAEAERDEALRSGAPNRAVDAQFIVWRDRAESAEALLAECQMLIEDILSGYLDFSRARTLLAKLEAGMINPREKRG